MKYVIVDTRTDKAIAFGTATNSQRPEIEIWNHMNLLEKPEEKKGKDHLTGYTQESDKYQHYVDIAFQS